MSLFSRRRRVPERSRTRRVARTRIEALEERCLLAAFFVNSTADPGDGVCAVTDCTLREAIDAANANSGADDIMFSIPGAGPHTIMPVSPLPTITESVNINGYSQLGASANTLAVGNDAVLLIEIVGANVVGGADGLVIAAGGSTVRGLVINRFLIGSGGLGGNGIRLDGGGGNVVDGNFIGTNVAGTAAAGNEVFGVLVFNSSDNTIGGLTPAARNVIAGNLNDGVNLQNPGTTRNVIVGNFIGTAASGAAAIPNAMAGIHIVSAPENTIGGTAAGEGNVISGNNTSGILLQGVDARQTVIQGNRIGTDATGMADVGNRTDGVVFAFGANQNTVGGTAAGAGNVLSGNDQFGVFVFGNATDNVVEGNFIGTDRTGTTALGNRLDGVAVQDSPRNRIGGDAAGAGNLISANGFSGISLFGAQTSFIRIQGNRIGTDVSGSSGLGNGTDGIFTFDANNITIGGTTAEAANLISANAGNGISIFAVSAGVDAVSVMGNFIGTDAAGGSPLGNQGHGVLIQDAVSITIGGTAAGAGNLISGNAAAGVLLDGNNNAVTGNLIGTDATGTIGLPNDVGVEVAAGRTGNLIGGTTVAERNVIAANATANVRLFGDANFVEGNFIGVDATGTAGLGFGDGVVVNGNNNVIDAVAGTPQVISGNATGVFINGGLRTVVQNNFIGTDVMGTIALGNLSDGVLILDSSDNTIGGAAAGAGNVISANFGSGVVIDGSPSVRNVVQGNLIGTEMTGSAGLGNRVNGVQISSGASANTIGGAAAGARNVISGGNGRGVDIFGGASANLVQANLIGTDVTGTVALGNLGDGVLIDQASTNNTVGGTAAGARNVISANSGNGVTIAQIGTTGNLVQGNFIGTDVSGAIDFGNQGDGVAINDSSSNTIGGLVSGAQNVISGNAGDGVSMQLADGNVIQGNVIGRDSSGAAPLGNDGEGVFINNGRDNIIGGGNVISANQRSGVAIFSFGVGSGNVVQGNVIGGTSATLGNRLRGVDLFGNASNNTIGGTVAGAGNTIQFNGDAGVFVDPISFGMPVGNSILGNSVADNAQLGIDLLSSFNSGVTPNDPGDPDTGANELQNFPDITGATLTAGTLTLDYVVDSATANSLYPLRVEFFRADAAGEEGQAFLGFNTYAAAEATMTKSFSFAPAAAVAIGDRIVATATDANGNTSEFSAPVQAQAVSISLSISDAAPIAEGGGGTAAAMFNVTISADPTTPVTVTVNTADGIANPATAADGDFQPINNQMLTFMPGGPLTQIVSVSVAGDAKVELNETFFVNLSNAMGAAVTDGQGVGTITNDDRATITINSVAQVETDAGQTAFTFNVTLSQQVDLAVTVQADTEDGSASTADNDYQAVTGQVVNFPPAAAPGAQTQTVTVQVNGDTAIEPDEMFEVVLRTLSAGGRDVTFAPSGSPAAGIQVLAQFDPANAGGLCGLGYDQTADEVWVYDCLAADIQRYSTAGAFLSSVPRPGESANDADVEFAPEPLTLAGVALPAGTLLFINGETAAAEIYAVDKSSGSVLATLPTAFGMSHVVGGAYHPLRDTFFLVQDNVPGAADENRIAEIDPNTGGVINNFQITSFFQVNFGDIEVCAATGNLLVVSDDESRIAEFAPGGAFVAYHALPAAVDDPSGIGLDDARGEAWVAGTGGSVRRLGGLPCGAVGQATILNDDQPADLVVTKTDSPDPAVVGRDVTYTVTVMNAGPGPGSNVMLTDTLPAGVAFVSATGGAMPVGGVLTFNLGTLASDAGASVQIVVRPTTPKRITNTVSAAADQDDPIAANNTNIAQPTDVCGFEVTTIDVIDNTDDFNSLREAILCANLSPGQDTITFNIPGSGPHTIQPTSALPTITSPVVINGYSQMGASANTNVVGQGLNTILMIELSGTLAGGASPGLRIAAGGAGSTIRGLAINRFARDGVEIVAGSSGNLIDGSFIGTNIDGTTGAANGRSGILVLGDGNTIGGVTPAARNLISGNGDNSTSFNGVRLEFADNNVVQGSIIGLDRAGMNVIANNGNGISDISGANNTFGGAAAGAGNVISGNVINGIVVQDLAGATAAAGTRTLIAGNRIGTDVTGTLNRGNGFAGVILVDVTNVTIGGTTAGAANLISGNQTQGVFFAVGTNGSRIQGNFIGTNANGTVALGNTLEGVLIQDSAGNTVGGTTAGAGNVISGNTFEGLRILGNGAAANVVQGNFIGTDFTGTIDLGNSLSGVVVQDAPNNTIGGTAAGARNVVSGNTTFGVVLTGVGAVGNVVESNFVGTDVSGAIDLGNTLDGVLVNFGAQNNTIGGTSAAARNIISANGNHGVAVSSAGTTGTLIIGNFIGTDMTGTLDLGNGNDGVNSGGGPTGTTVGGPNPGEGNVISGNQNDGVEFQSGSNLLVGNFIGVNSFGTAALGNTMHGININDQSLANTIGGTAAGAGNVISANIMTGILILGVNSTANLIQANRIGTDAAGAADLGNSGPGILVLSALNTIGGTATGAGNLISGNGGPGILIANNTATANLIQGNLIGTNAVGTADLGNSDYGVLIVNGAAMNTIGGTTTAGRNIISGNNSDGVAIFDSATTGNVVQGNFIGTDVSGAVGLGNLGNGVLIAGGGRSNRIGTNGDGVSDSTESNVIAGNIGRGVLVVGIGADRNVVAGNFIGTDATGTVGLGNGDDGVVVQGGAQFNRIGTDGNGVADDSERNVISGNQGRGVWIIDAGTDSNVVAGNFIGTNAAGTAGLANGADGVIIEGGAQQNLVGSNADGVGDASERNLLSGNLGHGVRITGAATERNTVAGNFIGTNASGTAALSNGFIGVLIIGGASNNTVGGTTAGARNIISGNGSNGVEINGAGSSANVVQGNFIGTDVNGTAGLGNGLIGMLILSGPTNNTIGGTAAGARNVISGNGSNGVEITGAGSSGNVVQGNFIGTDVTGTVDLGNGLIGMLMLAGATNNTVGGTTAGARNVISGNGSNGVEITGAGSNGNVVQGNFIGTNATGAVALANSFFGVLISNGASNNTLGGTTAGARNVISGNGMNGIEINGGGSAGNLVQGNFVGTDFSGTADLGNSIFGVLITNGASNNTLGGTTAGARNVISGNGANGVEINGGGSTANLVQGNFIGTDVTGAAAVGNSIFGVLITNGASNNTIGGATASAENTIAFNGSGGAVVPSGTGNSIQRNSIFANAALGIDLGNDGVTANDPLDADLGPNNLQNFPALDLVFTGGGMTTVRGRLNSTPNTLFRLQFFANAACDPAGDGEGETFVGEVDAMTGAGGDAIFAASFPARPATDVITATATDPAGNTSEFSACAALVPAVELGVFKMDAPDPVQPGANLTYTITVFNNGPNNATGVQLTDTLPANVAFVSAAPAAAMCNEVSGIVECNIGNLAAGTQSVLTIVVTVMPGLPDGTILTNTATVAANEAELDPGNNTVTITTTVLSAQGIELLNFTTGALDTLQITYRVVGTASPPFDIGFFASADARFDGTDSERGPRILVNDPALLAPGEHLLILSGVPYEQTLLDPDVNFVLAVADVNNLVPETDETNNDINFRGIYHRPQSPAPLVIRGNDAGSRYALGPGGDVDVIVLFGGAPLGVLFDGGPLRNVNQDDVSVIRVVTASGDDLIRALSLATPLHVVAGTGNDTMSGGSENDEFFGSAGTDLIDFSDLPTGVRVNLSRNTARGRSSGRDRLAAIEEVIATESRDTILGDQAANRIMGLGGNDAIRGGGGSDFIDGGDGNDLIFGDDGNDQISGGDGDDILCGVDGDDNINGGMGNDQLKGGFGNDFLAGGIGNDILLGDDGNDILQGGDDRDSLNGGDGADNLQGDAGFDLLVIDGLDIFNVGADGGRVHRR